MKRKFHPLWLSVAVVTSLSVISTPRAHVGQAYFNHRLAQDSTQQAKEGDDMMSPDLQSLMDEAADADEQRVRVILQLRGKESGRLRAFLNREDVDEKESLQNFNVRVAELPLRLVKKLADLAGDVSYISPDREVRSLGHVELTTGTMAARASAGNAGLDGSGIGIAVLDSSIFHSHTSFLGRDGNKRAIADADFTGEGMNTDDPFGHGTHVAALAAGNNRLVGGAYTGIAPGAKLINLRVLNSQGMGTVSGLLGALNWVMSNRHAYNIRVVNLSLGTAAVDSYRHDPLCRAVRRLVDAGVVVVAAAGNLGKDVSGQKIYGLIHAPGNEPSAITVGATNTFGTDARSDDGIATYSSRGPTRSYWTNAISIKHYDNVIKPDLVAPGNKLISAEAKHNRLVTDYPELNAFDDDNDDHRMMHLSGTSMATPIVAGAAALLLQANPRLTPNMVKMILQYTAQPLAGFNHFEQGAGQVNVEGAVRLARLVRRDLTASTPLGAPLLTTSALPNTQTTVAGHTFTWSRGITLNHTYATGVELISKYQKIYGVGVTMNDGVTTSDGVTMNDGSMMTGGILLGDHVLTSSGVTMNDGVPFLSVSTLLGGSGVTMNDGTPLGDSLLSSYRYLFDSGVTMNDTFIQSLSVLVRGDDTAAMQ